MHQDSSNFIHGLREQFGEILDKIQKREEQLANSSERAESVLIKEKLASAESMVDTLEVKLSSCSERLSKLDTELVQTKLKLRQTTQNMERWKTRAEEATGRIDLVMSKLRSSQENETVLTLKVAELREALNAVGGQALVVKENDAKNDESSESNSSDAAPQQLQQREFAALANDEANSIMDAFEERRRKSQALQNVDALARAYDSAGLDYVNTFSSQDAYANSGASEWSDAEADNDFDDTDLEWHPSTSSQPAVAPDPVPVVTAEDADSFDDTDLEWHPSGEIAATVKETAAVKVNIAPEPVIIKTEAAPQEATAAPAKEVKAPEVVSEALKEAPIPVIVDEQPSEEPEEEEEVLEEYDSLPVVPPVETAKRFEVTTNEAILKEVKDADAVLNQRDYDQAWMLFTALNDKYPDVLQVRYGLYKTYVKSLCWQDACRVGLPLLYDISRTEYWDEYRFSLDKVLHENLDLVLDMLDRKKLLFGLAVVHLDHRAQALDYLRQAIALPGLIPEQGHIHYYLVRYADHSSRYRFEDVIGAMRDIAGEPSLFDYLLSVSSEDLYRARLPLVRVIESLFHDKKEVAKQAEDRYVGPVEVGPVELNPALIEEIHDDQADEIIEFLLNQLFVKADLVIPDPPQRSRQLLIDSASIPYGFAPASTLDRINRRLFKFRDYDTLYYKGKDKFWMEVVLDKMRVYFV